jgi:hypothetical protein
MGETFKQEKKGRIQNDGKGVRKEAQKCINEDGG